MSRVVALRKESLVNRSGGRNVSAAWYEQGHLGQGRGRMRGIAIAGSVASGLLWGTSAALLALGAPVAAMVFTVNAAVTVTVGTFFAWHRVNHGWAAGYEAGAAATYRA